MENLEGLDKLTHLNLAMNFIEDIGENIDQLNHI